MIKKKYNRGETLIETIIALSILSITITISGMIVGNSMQNLNQAKDRIIAVNLAREGIEAVRSIRDSNRLYYSDKKRECWNNNPNNTCDGTNLIPPGIYIVYKHTDGSWHLYSADNDLNNDGSDTDGILDNDVDANHIQLSWVDADTAVDSDNADEDNNDTTGNDDDLDLYNHKYTNIAGNSFGYEVKKSRFSRLIVIEYLENNPDSTTAPSNINPPTDSINTLNEWNDSSNEKDKLNRIRISSIVKWTKKNLEHQAKLETIITDYFGREDLET